MTAIATAVLAVIISRIASWTLVYRHQSYKKVVARYLAIKERQRVLLKRNSSSDLVGRDSNPAKSEYQASITQAQMLKKQVFKIKAPAISVTTAIMFAFGYVI